MHPSHSHNRTLITLLVAGFALSLPAVVIAKGETWRTAAGRPDLSDTYDAATLTPLERPEAFGDKLFLTREEANEIAKRERLLAERRALVSDPNREAPPARVNTSGERAMSRFTNTRAMKATTPWATSYAGLGYWKGKRWQQGRAQATNGQILARSAH